MKFNLLVLRFMVIVLKHIWNQSTNVPHVANEARLLLMEIETEIKDLKK